MSVEFWVTSIVVIATPGTGALFTIAAALTRGAQAGVVGAVGCTVGVVPHLVLALSGAAAVLTTSPVAFGTIKWLGFGYLLYLAWGAWRQTGVLSPEPASASSMGRMIGSAVLINLLNPKLAVFFFVFLPMFVDTTASDAIPRMAGLGAVFMVISLLIYTVYGICAAWLRQYVIGQPVVMRRISRGFAASFVVLAGMLAFTTQ